MHPLLSFVRRAQSLVLQILVVLLTVVKGVEGKNKRRQSGAWLYQRREPDIESAGILHSAPPPPEDLKPVIHVSKPGDELLPLEVLESGRSGKAGARQDAEAQGVAKFARSQKPAGSVAEPRRFHMTRSTGTVAHGGVSKRSRNSAAVFVERGSKRKRVSVGNDREPPDVIIEDTSAVDTEIEPATEVDPKMEVDEPTSRPLKRPGVAKRTAPAAAPAEKQAPRLPASFTNRWDVDMDQLARDMNAYTLEQIGYTLAQQDEEKAREAALTKPASTSPQKSKFKPKAPAKRWAERHPEAALQEKMQDVVTAPADTSMDSETDEDDFVVETYYRVPASALGGAVPPERVGLLVFDTEPDAEFFYGEGSDSEEDWGEDDDDENGTSPTIS